MSKEHYETSYGIDQTDPHDRACAIARDTEAQERRCLAKRQEAFRRSIERDNQARVILVGIGVVIVIFAAAVWLGRVALPEWLQ